MSGRLGAGVFGAALALNLAQAWYYLQRLPERVASHFDAAGAPNAAMGRQAFVGLYAGAVLFIAVMMLASGLSVERSPDARINLPNKAYWLAPERRSETMAWLRGFFLWFGAATMLLFLDMFHQVFRFNLGEAAKLEHPVLSLGLYVAASAVLVVLMMRRFRRMS